MLSSAVTLTPLRSDNDVFWNREEEVLRYTVNPAPALSTFTGIALISLHLQTRELDKESTDFCARHDSSVR